MAHVAGKYRRTPRDLQGVFQSTEIETISCWTSTPTSCELISSGVPPTAVATTGVPQARDSKREQGNPSLELGKQVTSAALYHRNSSSFFTAPCRKTCRSRPSAETSRCKGSPKSPSPTMNSRIFGNFRHKPATARIRTRWPFLGINCATAKTTFACGGIPSVRRASTLSIGWKNSKSTPLGITTTLSLGTFSCNATRFCGL